MAEQFYETSIVLEAAQAHQRAFDDMTSVVMHGAFRGNKGADYDAWNAANPDYTPTFGARIGDAIEWAKQNPVEFEDMVFDLDAAIDFLNEPAQKIDDKLFPNIAEYWKTRKDGAQLPTVMGAEEGEVAHNKWTVLRAAVEAARKLRYGETIRPADADFYSYHNFVKSDKGMAAASLVDLYENYATVLGLNPESAERESVLANALTEAVYISSEEDGELFSTLRNPADGWIEGCDGFSNEFQLVASSLSPRKISLKQTDAFEREGFSGNLYVTKSAELGFTALQVEVHGSHSPKRMLDGTTRTYYVVGGEGAFTLNGETHSASKGDYFVIPPGGTYDYSGEMTLLETNISPDNSFADEKLPVPEPVSKTEE